MTCKAGVFGHSPAMAGEGCAGCDAEHVRMMDKHVGPAWRDGAYYGPFEAGAAVAFGLMGMARAIQLRSIGGRVCSRCGGRDDFLLCGACQHEVSGDDRGDAAKSTDTT